jgi:putative ATP-binding cassette transporter
MFSSLRRFVQEHMATQLAPLFGLGTVVGLSSALLLHLVNKSAESAAQEGAPGVSSLFLYGLAFVALYVCTKKAMLLCSSQVEEGLGGLRLRITAKLQEAPFLFVEGLGQSQLLMRISQETRHLSQLFPSLVNSASQMVALVFCLCYTFFLSPVAFGIFLAGTAAVVYYYVIYRQKLDTDMRKVTQLETDVSDSLEHLLRGCKELNLNEAKRDAFEAHFQTKTQELEQRNKEIGLRWSLILNVADLWLLSLLGLVVFVLPQFLSDLEPQLYKLVAVMMFNMGPVSNFIFTAPLLSKANLGLEQLYELEKQLDEHRDPEEEADPTKYKDFQNIAFQDYQFSYRDDQGKPVFTTGPWELSLKRGEVVFLTGGNGAGKSTALRLLCGLLEPDAGTLTVDGQEVTSKERQHFREIFSAVFADFHLFERLYGAEDVPTKRVNELLELMQLEDKVDYTEGRFSQTKLSTGQRKRLALVACLLEDRPVYILDEWAADQDVQFRKIYYEQILPDLKKQGKTVLVVTHDDRYWKMSDRLVKMELGGFVKA